MAVPLVNGLRHFARSSVNNLLTASPYHPVICTQLERCTRFQPGTRLEQNRQRTSGPSWKKERGKLAGQKIESGVLYAGRSKKKQNKVSYFKHSNVLKRQDGGVAIPFCKQDRLLGRDLGDKTMSPRTPGSSLQTGTSLDARSKGNFIYSLHQRNPLNQALLPPSTMDNKIINAIRSSAAIERGQSCVLENADYSKVAKGLDNQDLDLVGDAYLSQRISGENDSYRVDRISKAMRTEPYRSKNEMAPSAKQDVNKDKPQWPEISAYDRYKHLLYDDKRYQSNKKDRRATERKAKKSKVRDVQPPLSSTSTGFILVDERLGVQNGKAFQSKSIGKSKNKEIFVQREMRNGITSNLSHTSKISPDHSYMTNAAKPKAEDEHAFIAPKDQMENYIFGCDSRTSQTGLATPKPIYSKLSSVCVKELKPDVETRTPSIPTEPATIITEGQREISEPVLTIKPNEIGNKKNRLFAENPLLIFKNINAAGKENCPPPNQHGRNQTKGGVPATPLNEKYSLTDQLLSSLQQQNPNAAKYGLKEPKGRSERHPRSKNVKQEAIDKQTDALDRKTTLTPGGTHTDSYATEKSNLVDCQVFKDKKKSSSFKREIKVGEVSKQLKEQWKNEFREKFQQMQKDRLFAQASYMNNAIKSSKPSKQKKNRILRKFDLTKNEDRARKFAPTSKHRPSTLDSRVLQKAFSGTGMPSTPTMPDSKSAQKFDGEVPDPIYLDPYEEWAKRQDELYQREITLMERHEKRDKNTILSQRPRSPQKSPLLAFGDKSGLSCKKSPEKKSDKTVKTISHHSQDSEGQENHQTVSESSKFPKKLSPLKEQKLSSFLNQLDGLLAMTLDPVGKHAHTNKGGEGGRKKLGNLTPSSSQMAAMFPAGGRQPSCRERLEERQLQRYIAAFERHKERKEREKEEKRNKNKKKRKQREMN